ncbi:hypothetical protein D9M70_447630 [compost metagenome]
MPCSCWCAPGWPKRLPATRSRPMAPLPCAATSRVRWRPSVSTPRTRWPMPTSGCATTAGSTRSIRATCSRPPRGWSRPRPATRPAGKPRWRRLPKPRSRWNSRRCSAACRRRRCRLRGPAGSAAGPQRWAPPASRCSWRARWPCRGACTGNPPIPPRRVLPGSARRWPTACASRCRIPAWARRRGWPAWLTMRVRRRCAARPWRSCARSSTAASRGWTAMTATPRVPMAPATCAMRARRSRHWATRWSGCKRRRRCRPCWPPTRAGPRLRCRPSTRGWPRSAMPPLHPTPPRAPNCSPPWRPSWAPSMPLPMRSNSAAPAVTTSLPKWPPPMMDALRSIRSLPPAQPQPKRCRPAPCPTRRRCSACVPRCRRWRTRPRSTTTPRCAAAPPMPPRNAMPGWPAAMMPPAA